jgi:signal transduction histidine kinase
MPPRRPRRLRTRLLVAMVAIALGTLVLTALVTAGLARTTAVDNARDDLAARGEILAPELDRLIARLPTARVATEVPAGRRQVQRIGEILNTSLRASDGAVIGIDEDGRPREVLGLLLGAEGGPVALPEGVTVADLDTAALQAGETRDGREGEVVYKAIPLAEAGDVRPVLVLAEQVSTRPFGDAGGAVLGAALLALGVAAGVAAFLARRLTRPVAAMEATARSIAGGDLAARVDESHVRDDELGSLAHAINGMAEKLEDARGHERAFLLSVSHDLRTPLTSIRGYSEAIADGTVQGPDNRIRAARVISSESRRLERLVADLLDLARLDTHQFSLQPGPMDAHDVVAEAVEAFQPSAAELGLALTMADGGPVAVTGDAQRLAQVVGNLVENALKFATARVDVAVQVDDDRFLVQVDDDGAGISPADLARVFDRLYTSRAVPGRVVGTGIGLAIVRELAVAMGGTARVEAVDGIGTRFVVDLPFVGPGAVSGVTDAPGG